MRLFYGRRRNDHIAGGIHSGPVLRKESDTFTRQDVENVRSLSSISGAIGAGHGVPLPDMKLGKSAHAASTDTNEMKTHTRDLQD